ncbi:hypothetical protein [Pseudomonas sp. PDM11]|uniref:hypothetical protein n=1 Tax=Pseudomonas sp. PDM11 TaxID=2769309 RepID=UPI00177F8CC5|nr:hypothetical protein [Pseudomonas sp. PDM11]MBD9398309.1 hypothetical protein [Pseudomonas sp. PDM11]
MTGETEFNGRKLIILRLVAIAMILSCANYAYEGYLSGIISVGTGRHSLVMVGDNLWLGYVFLLSTAIVSTLLIFANHRKTKAFGRTAKVAGMAWFATFIACALQ